MNDQIQLAGIQPANIGPQDVPKTSLSNIPGCPLRILFVHLGDVPIWRPENVSMWRLKSVPNQPPGGVFSEEFLERLSKDLQSTSYRCCRVVYWMILNLILLFFLNSMQYLEEYLEPSQASEMELSCVNS